MLEVDHVVKQYDKVLAVNQISFEAHPGRVLGLLGPNGAGKTSTIRMITYITIPDQGEVRLDGKPVGVWSQERMGYLPEERGLYKKLKVGEQLLYLAELKGMTRSDAKKEIYYWLDRMGAADWVSKKTEELSKGMQQKIQFISTILHNPRLLILDEPFGGLDPINAELLKNIIMDLKGEGRIILFASHRMEQVEQLCDDLCLVSKGEVLLNGPVREVKRQFGRNHIILEFEGDDAFLQEMEGAGLIEIIHRTSGFADLKIRGDVSPREILDKALHHTDELYRFERAEPSLNEIFVSAVEGQQKEVVSSMAP